MCKVSARTQHEKTWTNSTGFEADMWYNILVAFRSHRPASCLLARACPLRGALAGPKRAGFRGASLLYGRGRGRLVGDQPARERVRPREGADGLLGRPGESSVHVVYNPSSKGSIGYFPAFVCVVVVGIGGTNWLPNGNTPDLGGLNLMSKNPFVGCTVHTCVTNACV